MLEEPYYLIVRLVEDLPFVDIVKGHLLEMAVKLNSTKWAYSER